MKANELMIDDWVYMSENDIPRRITDIGRFDLISSYGITCYVDNIHPIPITPEILEKNFGSALNGCYFEGDEFYELIIHEVNEGTWIIKHDNIEFSNIPRQQVMVSYVHELQHALRICGIEKEIDLC